MGKVHTRAHILNTGCKSFSWLSVRIC